MAAAGKFSCGGCSKGYTWKAELAGRRVKCKCGQVMTVPKEDPALAEATEPNFDDLYALADGTPVADEAITPPPLTRSGGACPSCGASVETGAVLCVKCGHSLKTGKKLKTRSESGGAGIGAPALAGAGAGGGAAMLGYASMAPRRPGREAGARTEVFWSPGKDLYVPLALILVGSILTYVDVWFNRGVQSPIIAMFTVAILTVINLVLTIPAVLVTVKLFDLGLGPLPTGMLKIAACAIFPGALASMLIKIGDGGFVAWGVSLGVTLGLFMWMLDMDFYETCICSVLIWLVRNWLAYAILFLFMGSMMSGNSGGGGLASGGGRSSSGFLGSNAGPPPPSPSKLRAEFDNHASTLLATGNFDARDWLKQNATAVIHGLNHDQSVEMVNTLYTMNAKDVRSVNHAAQGFTANGIVVTLPTNADAREKIFDWYDGLENTLDDSQSDVGQKYLSIELSE